MRRKGKPGRCHICIRNSRVRQLGECVGRVWLEGGDESVQCRGNRGRRLKPIPNRGLPLGSILPQGDPNLETKSDDAKTHHRQKKGKTNGGESQSISGDPFFEK